MQQRQYHSNSIEKKTIICSLIDQVWLMFGQEQLNKKLIDKIDEFDFTLL